MSADAAGAGRPGRSPASLPVGALPRAGAVRRCGRDGGAAVARVAGLVGIAALAPLLGGRLDVATFHLALAAAAALVAAAGVMGAPLIRNPRRVVRAA
jgi:hypothetical protein